MPELSTIGKPRKRTLTKTERRLRQLDPDLAAFCDMWEADDQAFFDEMDQRLRAAQDAEEMRHPPIDWHPEREALDEERARLLVAGGNAIDAIMDIGELHVNVARHAAGIEAAEMMANAGLRMPRAILPSPPDDPWAAEAGDIPDDDDDHTDQLRAIHDDAKTTAEAETTETQTVWVPSWRADTTIVEADAIPTGRKPHRYGRGWWAGAAAWTLTLPALAFGGLVAACSLLGWGT